MIVDDFKKDYELFLTNTKQEYNHSLQHHLLRNSFIETNGKINIWAHNQQKIKTPYSNKIPNSIFFSNLCNNYYIDNAVKDLHNYGYHIIPALIPNDQIIDAVMIMNQLIVTNKRTKTDKQKLCNIQPKWSTYWHTHKDLTSISLFRKLITDNLIKEIIGRYLECSPVFDFATSWWSFPYKDTDNGKLSAQQYHFDLDRVRWVKVFCYLTDVDENNGPHAFLSGSHNNLNLFRLQDKRYSDEEIFNYYNLSQEKIITGLTGTIFLEDTIGFHKGLPLKNNKRGIFEFEYSINNYGAYYENVWD